MSDEVVLYDSVATSNLRPREKSKVIQLLEQAMPKDRNPQTVLGMLVETSVAGTVGATLGLLQSELKDGLDYNQKYPLDLALGVVSKVGGKVYSSSISREIGSVAIGIYSYRKVEALMSMLKPKPAPVEEEPVAAE